ncbi:dnaJ homolog subfamily C member 17-like isoform X2 [Bacillus rossius redtenbacheri]|uniref:dnaJ homolog subfamily C member 17-like isoform X2 n=1 Tax=Bacillus rossius redtenbacheri TaxID=93214 RepID=UPI002FDE5F0E
MVVQIKKAYRQKALKCHPDKLPDNPKAAELFHELTRALEILTDEAARAAYDAVHKAKTEAKQRRRSLSSRYKKLREDLEERERRAQEEEARLSHANFHCRTDEDKLEAEVERLRKEGSRQVKEEQEAVRQQLLHEARVKEAAQTLEAEGSRLRVTWRAARDDPSNGGYDYTTLHTIFSKHGEVTALILSAKKKGSALVEYSTMQAAELARELERGVSSNPVSVHWLREASEKQPISSPRANPEERRPVPAPAPAVSAGGGDFEELVLRRMRQAAEKQGLERSAEPLS